MKIKYCCFWSGFDEKTFFINDYFKDYTIVDDDSYDVIIMSVFNYHNLKVKDNAIKILFNGEHPSYIDNFIKYTKIKLDLIIGFTNNLKKIKQVYYPLWILYYNNYSDEYFNKKNKEVSEITIEDINKKKFCCLINSHDSKNTRIPIFLKLLPLGKIDCPGKLLHNIDSIGGTSEDKIKFMNNYKFNICSENGKGYQYMTEKLPQSIEALCIPIYYGDMGSTNTKIFNKNRIINITDINNLTDDIDKIKNLLEKSDELLKFYRQPIFNEGTYKYIKQMKDNVKTAIEKLTYIPNG